MDGLVTEKIKLQNVDGSIKIFLGSSGSGTSSKIQIQSGEIAGNLAADIVLIAAKNSLDDLTKTLVAEFNEVHQFGVDLNGDSGEDFFSLDAVEIKKSSTRESTSQLRVEGNLVKNIGDRFYVKYDAAKEIWSISDNTGKLLKEFVGSAEIDGLRFNTEGKPALGDSFTVKVSNNASENLQLKINDGKKIAASSFYSVEPNISNISNTEV